MDDCKKMNNKGSYKLREVVLRVMTVNTVNTLNKTSKVNKSIYKYIQVDTPLEPS